MAVETPPPELGAPCPDFRLPAVDGNTYGRDDFRAKPVLVVMFICNHCPYVKAVEDRLIKLAREFEPRGVQVVGVCANDAENYPDDAFDKLAARWRERGYGFPYLHDEAQDVARAFGAVCTPDIFVFDRERPSRLPRPHRRFVEGREPRHPARAGGGDRGAGGGRAAVARAAAVDGVLDQMATALRVSKNGGGALARHGGGRIPRVPGETYLQRKGLKTTQQREAIVDAFLRTSGHVALEDLLSQARRKHPGVGLATVYRTVKLLEEAGIAAARHFGPGQTLYEIAEGPGAPRPPDLRQLRLHPGVRERRDRGAAGRGRAPIWFQRSPPSARAVRPLREGARAGRAGAARPRPAVIAGAPDRLRESSR